MHRRDKLWFYLEQYVHNVPAPRLYAVYHDAKQLFLVMQRAPGVRLSSIWPSLTESDKDDIVAKLRKAVDTLRQAKTPWPDDFYGSLDGGGVHHYLFYLPDFKARFYEISRPRILQGHRPTLTHGDIQPKNIVVAERGRNSWGERSFDITLVDWEAAGWYSDFWEYFSAFSTPAFLDWTDDWRWRIHESLQIWPAEMGIMRMMDKDWL
ncbi:unnamed protein product [Penicillium egyptiacum]|uniref:Aminoglycoside phosphotransferase domain-containing protein n=1 Tax=Penicillium egyptiacum TaxID=1303716 RepID=A0A9W4P946_9EURO|nr:unnamed protein product [Penicillium egyptiacum]